MTGTSDAPSEPSSLLRYCSAGSLHHKWVRRFDPESSEHYLQCTACGKDRSWAAVTRFR